MNTIYYSEPAAVLRNDYVKKNGEIPVLIRVRLNGKVLRYSAGLSILPQYWDKKAKRIRKVNTETRIKDKKLEKKLNRAREIILTYWGNSWYLDHKIFKREFALNSGMELDNFNEYVKTNIENERARYSDQTLKTYRTELSKLRRFNSEIAFNQINRGFLMEYYSWMKYELNNSDNTRNKSLSFLRTWIRKLYQEKKIEKNPFDDIQIKFKPGVRPFLTIDEIELIRKYEPANDFEIAVKDAYLFSVFTGLRFGDISSLRDENITENHISIKMRKTARPLYVPIVPGASEILNKRNKTGLIFDDLPCNQVTNRILKEVARKAGITKNITFHTARHTFATVALNAGISIKIVQAVLGHNRLSTTELYAKLATKTIKNELDKFPI